MFYRNSGYIGYSRSVRSQRAVNDYEVPMSMISRSFIDEFLDTYEDDFTPEELNQLRKTSVTKWKYAAKERVSSSSWHHTSKFFNKTDHYSLSGIAEVILSLGESLDAEYKAYQESKRTDPERLKRKIAAQREKEEIEARKEKTALFKYQSKYKTLSGFMRADIDIEVLKVKKAAVISAKREELRKMWEKQLPPDHWCRENIDDDAFIEQYIK